MLTKLSRMKPRCEGMVDNVDEEIRLGVARFWMSGHTHMICHAGVFKKLSPIFRNITTIVFVDAPR